MSYWIINNSNETDYCDEFEDFIEDLDLIGSIDLYENFTNDELYKQCCEIFKNAEYANDKSLLKQVDLLSYSLVLVLNYFLF